MADYVTVANLALSKLGENDQLRDPDQDSHSARTVRAVWIPIRKAVLRKGNWNFAITRAELAAEDPTTPGVPSSYPFTARFPVPSDYCRLVEVLEPKSIRESYKFERRAILADTVGPVYIRYVADIEETGLWDDLFVEAFASRLAFQIASRITGGLDYKQACWRDYRQAMADAVGVDAKEDPPVETDDSSWITARFG